MADGEVVPGKVEEPKAAVAAEPSVTPAAAPVPPVEPVTEPAAEGEKNVFTELFGTDAAKKSGLMENVVKQEDKSGKLLDIKDEVKKKTKKRSAQNANSVFLKAVILLWIVGSVFFFTQNSERFSLLGVNAANRAAIASEQLEQAQADINIQKHLSAVLLFDQYSKVTDEYFFNLDQSVSEYNSQNKREDFKKDAKKIRPDAVNLLKDLQMQLQDLPSAEEVVLAKAAIDEIVAELGESAGTVDEDTLLQEIQDFDSAKTLMQSKSFKQSVVNVNADEATDEDLKNTLDGYAEINRSVSTIIREIQALRTDWSFYYDELEHLIKTVDPLYNTEFESNINISQVSFSENLALEITGQTSTSDSKNFTLTSNLIDVLEDSPHFHAVQERSYAKSESTDTYEGGFRLSLMIETENNEE
ncbi:hypothetical protein HOD30_05550 [Candidatus Peregrinibacteria bacterium]|jgi:hypothetical protein|nr:hypothetical protein [Candidatus Peregrinibacteria bacterium]MBT4631487.1 hypothetical protein [Candidatus Peregrinibacteria bacterium]MBT5516593.1 hypothetical protein [Candidatus Peregrinibacteria bacterium]MBT5823876.1 hypothetical protein [Candidatus Peregrinibacteria bacterium]